MDAIDLLWTDCTALLDASSEGAQAALARSVLQGYVTLGPSERVTFLNRLAQEMGPDPDAVGASVSAWVEGPGTATLRAMLRATEPPRRRLLRRLHVVEGATRVLVGLRADLLAAAGEVPALRMLDLDLRHLLRQWFARTFLELRRIDWSTSALVLERIATNEAVHEVTDWLDLRARVRSRDRRCYGFFHPAMPDEPLIFVMVALTDGLPATIAEVLDPTHDAMPAEAATTAVFYSISDCQPGLRGVSLGNFLIKRVVDELSAALPGLEEFRTLSPITGLARWADEVGIEEPGSAEGRARLAARYLLAAPREDGQPHDPVARFHLGNGATLDRILPDADPSETGRRRAFGVMASYRYDLDRVIANHDTYVGTGRVPHTPAVAALLT